MVQHSSRTASGAESRPMVEGTGARAMEELVKRLTDNYFDVSFDYGKPDAELEEEYQRVFGSTREFQTNRRCRNIVVVGAGASYAAFGGSQFPLAKDAITRIKKYLGVRGLIDALRYSEGRAGQGTDRITEEEERIELLTRVDFPRHDFESQLAIYSKFYAPRQVRAAIKNIYDHRYHPHLIFETIAHLLKHRFVDAVINYNFDELLDQAIEEELAGGEYRQILSDGDTDDLARFVVDEQLKVPLYIKPHGTARHKSSLRFTKDDYLGIPNDLQEFTRKILHGDTCEDPDSQREHFHVNLICVGFAFGSIELVHALRKHRGLTVFHVNTLRAMRGLVDQVNLIKSPVKQFCLGIRTSPDEEKEPGWPSMEAVFDELQKRITGRGEPGRFRAPYAPRSLDRHLIVHRLLFRAGCPELDSDGVATAPGDWPDGSGVRLPVKDKHYHFARLCVEIAISLAKGNGKIDLTGAMQDRVGIYYKLWRDCDTGEGRPLRDVCSAEFGLTENYGFSRTIYGLPYEKLSGRPGEGITARAAGFITRSLFDSLKRIDDDPFRDHVAEVERTGEVHDLLRNLIRSDAHDIAPTFDMRSLVLITEPRHARAGADVRRAVLHTSLSMISRFQEMVSADHWHLLLAISENGKVVEKLLKALTAARREQRMRTALAPGRPAAGSTPSPLVRKRMSLIVADHKENPQIDRRLARFKKWGLILRDADYRLPFWAHNNHMVVAMRMDFDPGTGLPVRWTPVRGIAYSKPALSGKVNPILVEQQEDLERLVTMYFGYVAKAMAYSPARASDGQALGVPNVDLDDVQSLRDQLLQTWWNTIAADAGLLSTSEKE